MHRSRLAPIKFGAVGTVNTAIDLGIYFVLTRTIPFFDTFLGIAKAVSYAAGAAFSFTANRNWIFGKSGKISGTEVLRFAATSGSALAINTTTLFLAHGILGIHDLVAALMATGVSFVWNFILSRSWVFTMKPQAATRAA